MKSSYSQASPRTHRTWRWISLHPFHDQRKASRPFLWHWEERSTLNAPKIKSFSHRFYCVDKDLNVWSCTVHTTVHAAQLSIWSEASRLRLKLTNACTDNISPSHLVTFTPGADLNFAGFLLDAMDLTIKCSRNHWGSVVRNLCRPTCRIMCYYHSSTICVLLISCSLSIPHLIWRQWVNPGWDLRERETLTSTVIHVPLLQKRFPSLNIHIKIYLLAKSGWTPAV